MKKSFLQLFKSKRPAPYVLGGTSAQPLKTLNVFATMCIHRHIDPESFGCILSLLMCPSPKFVFSRRRGDALIDRARSFEASRFLFDPKHDVLLFLDDDIVYKAEDAVAICKAAHEKQAIVGGAYVLKQDGGGQFTTKFLKESPSLKFGLGGDLHEVRMVATGFMAIPRVVLEQMSQTMPACLMRENQTFYPFFQPFPKQIDGKWYYLSEDWAFCERARDLGFKVYCDTRIKLGHAGRKIYSWDDFKHGKAESIDSFIYNEKISDADSIEVPRGIVSTADLNKEAA